MKKIFLLLLTITTIYSIDMGGVVDKGFTVTTIALDEANVKIEEINDVNESNESKSEESI